MSDAAKTMTVAQLREKLNEYPQDMPVAATWEGVVAKILPENFVVERVGKIGVDCLLIDVEDYWA